MEALYKIYEVYKKCEKIVSEEKSKGDSEDALDQSKNRALDLLIEAKKLISKQMEFVDSNSVNFNEYKATEASLTALLADIYLEKKELSEAEDLYMECLASIPDPFNCFLISVSVEVRNGLGLLCYHKCQLSEAKKWFEEAENLYVKFRKEGGVAKDCFDVFEISEDESEKALETKHTMTKFYLAKVYRDLNDTLKSAVYCHETLKRELLSKEYDPISWAVNSANLSQVFVEKELWKLARHHLAAASYVLDIYEKSLKDSNLPPEQMEAIREKFRHTSADVSTCWAKYGIFLLEFQKNTAKEEKENYNDINNLKFHDLDLSIYENQITDSYVNTFEEAREVFIFTQKHLNKAKEYYTLEDRASDHVQIVQDHSLLFRHLMAFEPDEERQFKMMKKRTSMLEAVSKELNPKYYLDMCRQLWFEIGDTYHDMMEISFRKVQNLSEVPSPQALLKINSLAENSAANFNRVLDSLKDQKTKELPDPPPEELLQLTLITHFCLGRLYYKYITKDKQKQIENTKKACDCFKYLVDCCEKSEKARSVVGDLLDLSKEMMTLLQMRILQL